MALNVNDLKKLAKQVARADRSSQVAYSFKNETFSYSDLNEALRSELSELGKDYRSYQANKDVIFSLLEESIDDVLPVKVMEQWGKFAETKSVPQGDKAVFVQKTTIASKRRAKQFITRVGLAGKYEVFKLDGRNYEVPTAAYGGAAQISLEEFLDGRMDFAELLDIVMEALDEIIYVEIEKALKGAIDNLPTANTTTQTAFDETEMDKLISIARSYGRPVIYCTYEFAATMLPPEGWVSDDMRNAKWNNGYLGNYKGSEVVILPQSYTDETNEHKVIDPSYAWIIPTGNGNEKPIKIVFEGQTLVQEFNNHDWSRDIHVYKKVGIAAMMTNNICVYRNTSLTM